MGTSRQELEAEHAQLKQLLQNRHADVVRHDANDEEFAHAYELLLAAADGLLAFERDLPQRRAEPERQLSERIVRASWWGQTAVGVVLIVTVLLLDRSVGWLFILVPHTLGVLAGATQKVTMANHRARRRLAIGLHLECALVAVVALHLISLWFVILALGGWFVLAGGILSDEPAKKDGVR
ncbi:hypothetical protein ABZ916_09460 [Streptomyces sp. NPDC046853]|uniref:hypothetical protein n=1 Tax=Streptomyces sp. NPDC046853 TaxID=3154920 RepID=UPI0033DEA8EF